MAYIVNQDIIDRVGNAAAVQLTTDSGAVVDTAVLDSVREGAEREVDRYVSKRHRTPVDVSTDADLASAMKALALDVAEYKLLQRRPPIHETKQRMYDAVIKWLESFAKGEANLPGNVTPESTHTDNPISAFGSNTPNLSTMRDSL